MIEMDGFDCLPDSLILLIFNSVSDVKTLIRCRTVSKRFNFLVPQTESLLLRVDRVISDSDSDFLLLVFFKFVLKSLHDLFKPDLNPPAPTLTHAQILSRFDRIRTLRIELPAGDLNHDEGLVIKWRAVFGETLRSCVILAFRAAAGNPSVDADFDSAEGLKARVVWTISALIAASARHALLMEVVKGHREMEGLVLTDREGEGTLVMDKEGLGHCRRGDDSVASGSGEERRTVVPSVRMRMRHAPRVELKDGTWAEGAALVVVRPCGDVGSDVEDADMAMGAFGCGIYGEAVRVLLKRRSSLLEMNSF